MNIIIKSPTRVDLSGGTLDMWPLFNFVGECTTINIAIDIYTTAEIKLRSDAKIVINSPDLNKKWEFENINALISSNDSSIDFYKIIFTRFVSQLNQLNYGFELTTTSESPIGGGLGGSSSLTISILKAIYHICKISIPEVNELVYLAHNIEAQLLKTPTGTQDYYPAITGGLSFINYNSFKTTQEVYSISGTPLEDHFLLVYTGKSHHSGLNNFEVLKSAVSGDQKVLDALSKINEISIHLKHALQSKKWDLIPELFKAEFAARIELTPAFTSSEIEKLADICLTAGALAVKICGAGGGGCVLVWVPPQNRERVILACQKEKFQYLNAKPVEPLNKTLSEKTL